MSLRQDTTPHRPNTKRSIRIFYFQTTKKKRVKFNAGKVAYKYFFRKL